MNYCPWCGNPNFVGPCPPEPPIGTEIRDRFGGIAIRHPNGGWAPRGFEPFAKWEAMWHARGPLEVIHDA